MQTNCNCKNKTPEMLEGGNCICNDCKCHLRKQNTSSVEIPDDFLQTKIRNYGLFILGTSTIIYTIIYLHF